MDHFQERRRDQEAAALSNIDVRQRTAGIPARYRGIQWGGIGQLDSRHTEALRACYVYARKFPNHLKTGESVVMSGSVGTGKTHACCLIANHVLKNRLRVLYHTEMGMASWIREKHWEARERIQTLANVDLLVIDEVGLDSLDDRDRSSVTEVISSRYAECRPMILATNAPFSSGDNYSLKSILGERVISRLTELGGPRLVFNWKSLRG